MLTRNQKNYFDICIKHEKIKDCISSPKEYEFENCLIDVGFREGIDYVHQFACCHEEFGKVYVADFAFPNEKVIVELDGKDHRQKITEDNLRDRVFNENGFVVIRVKLPLDEYHGIYWKYLIKETVEQIREKLYGKPEPTELD